MASKNPISAPKKVPFSPMLIRARYKIENGKLVPDATKLVNPENTDNGK